MSETEDDAKLKEDSTTKQQWWINNIVAPMMNSHRMNFSLIKHQIRSYDQFVFKYVPDIIAGFSKICFWVGKMPASSQSGTHSLHSGCWEVLPQDRRQFSSHFIKFHISPIQYRPSPFTIKICHFANETYKFDVVANIHLSIMDLQARTFLLKNYLLYSNLVICSIPIMARSKMCHSYGDTPASEILDPGGYFVLRGKEKVILAQEEQKHNFPMVEKGLMLKQKIKMQFAISVPKPKLEYGAEIKERPNPILHRRRSLFRQDGLTQLLTVEQHDVHTKRTRSTHETVQVRMLMSISDLRKCPSFCMDGKVFDHILRVETENLQRKAFAFTNDTSYFRQQLFIPCQSLTELPSHCVGAPLIDDDHTYITAASCTNILGRMFALDWPASQTPTVRWYDDGHVHEDV